MKIRFFILFLIFFGANFIFGEVFLLKNGDVITGKNIKMDEDTVFVLTSYGEISLDRENIENIFSDEEQYRLYKKSIESGG
ncbi:MAG TPA: hypothetical protein PLO89_10790 [Spirochaetota bacterium]|nr:hypothetical protein [Spirochaetota bacterium]